MSRPTDRDGRTEPVTEDRGSTDVYIRHVAHDLRAPINAIVGWAELVKAGQLSPEDSANAGSTIVRHARLLSRRIDEALDVWRLDRGLLDVAPRRVAVANAVRAAVESARPMFESRQVDCRLTLHAEPAAEIDVVRLVQALTLLLTDAATNTRSGQSVEVGVSVSHERAEVTIESGGLMPGDGAFARRPADTRPEAAARSYNFSLPLAHDLVALQGGTMNVAPVAGDRILFTLSWPAMPSPAQTL